MNANKYNFATVQHFIDLRVWVQLEVRAPDVLKVAH